ncbi:MAG: hypothetical protein RL266_1392 [Bacteroidota bacterium]
MITHDWAFSQSTIFKQDDNRTGTKRKMRNTCFMVFYLKVCSKELEVRGLLTCFEETHPRTPSLRETGVPSTSGLRPAHLLLRQFQRCRADKHDSTETTPEIIHKGFTLCVHVNGRERGQGAYDDQYPVNGFCSLHPIALQTVPDQRPLWSAPAPGRGRFPRQIRQCLFDHPFLPKPHYWHRCSPQQVSP